MKSDSHIKKYNTINFLKIDKDILREKLMGLYFDQDKSVKEISKILGWNIHTTNTRFKRLGICGKRKKVYFKPDFGDLFNEFKFLEEIKDENISGIRWKVECSCGNIKIIRAYNIINSIQKDCGHIIPDKARRSTWKGYGEISGQNFARYKRDASIRNLDFNITIEYIWDLYLKQNRKCALSGENISFTRRKCPLQTSSLDRIDSTKGYTLGNVQWVSKQINRCKQNYTDKEFIKMCRKVSKYNDEYSNS